MTDGSNSPLSRIALYHRLRRSSARLGLRTRILKSFTAGDGALLEYPVARRARIVAGSSTLSCQAERLSLLAIRVTTDRSLERGATVEFAIESWALHRWYIFQARVTEVEPEGHIKLQLVRFVGRTRPSAAVAPVGVAVDHPAPGLAAGG